MDNVKGFVKYFENKKLDYILDKIHKFGEDSLTDNESKYLKGEEVKEESKINPYLIKILSDYDEGKVTEEVFINFINKHISKKDLIEILLDIYKDGNLKKYIK